MFCIQTKSCPGVAQATSSLRVGGGEIPKSGFHEVAVLLYSVGVRLQRGGLQGRRQITEIKTLGGNAVLQYWQGIVYGWQGCIEIDLGGTLQHGLIGRRYVYRPGRQYRIPVLGLQPLGGQEAQAQQ